VSQRFRSQWSTSALTRSPVVLLPAAQTLVGEIAARALISALTRSLFAVQTLPSQCASSACFLSDPPAIQMSPGVIAAIADTPTSDPGAATRDQARPSQCRTRAPSCHDPTAQASSPDRAATAVREPPRTLGVWTTLQARPSQCSISGPPPTAHASSADVAATAARLPERSGLGMSR